MQHYDSKYLAAPPPPRPPPYIKPSPEPGGVVN